MHTPKAHRNFYPMCPRGAFGSCPIQQSPLIFLLAIEDRPEISDHAAPVYLLSVGVWG
ncbi:hypothetical protein J2129_000407 [Methanofollis sp. W23]|nr:hypothetical protein [Methanofollis sp. W23]